MFDKRNSSQKSYIPPGAIPTVYFSDTVDINWPVGEIDVVFGEDTITARFDPVGDLAGSMLVRFKNLHSRLDRSSVPVELQMREDSLYWIMSAATPFRD